MAGWALAYTDDAARKAPQLGAPATTTAAGNESLNMLGSLKNASVGVKVALSPSIGLLCLIFIGAVGWYANVNLGKSLSMLADDRMPRVILINRLDTEVTAVNSLVNQSMAWEGAGYKADKIAELDKRIGSELGRVGARLAALAAMQSLDDTEQKHVRKLLAEYAKFHKSSLEALDIKSGMLANAAGFMTIIDGTYRVMKESFDLLSEHEKKVASATAAAGHELVVRNKGIIIGSCLLAALLCAGFVILAVRQIVRPLHEASRLAQAMSHGDFTEKPPASRSVDATGLVLTALGEVSRNLGQIVTEIRTTADGVNRASHEIATGSTNLSRRTETTASALQQTAASLVELTETIRQSAGNAAQANTLARQASSVANEGGAAVAEVVATMQKIDAQAKKIREITGVIDSIAFQTNILALNAAVEAARAGDAGRGFAVVAQEVRTLAQRSATAAKEIRELIVASVDQVESGTHKVRAAGQTMHRIVESIQHVSATVDEISRAASEQASGIAQVNSAVSEMDLSTQQNAALVQHGAAAAESLKKQAHRLAESMSKLRTRETA